MWGAPTGCAWSGGVRSRCARSHLSAPPTLRPPHPHHTACTSQPHSPCIGLTWREVRRRRTKVVVGGGRGGEGHGVGGGNFRGDGVGNGRVAGRLC
eukprot:3049581-Rhodomonas_salina.3